MKCTHLLCVDDPEEAVIFELRNYPKFCAHCRRHYMHQKQVWDQDISLGKATKSLEELQLHLLKLRL